MIPITLQSTTANSSNPVRVEPVWSGDLDCLETRGIKGRLGPVASRGPVAGRVFKASLDKSHSLFHADASLEHVLTCIGLIRWYGPAWSSWSSGQERKDWAKRPAW